MKTFSLLFQNFSQAKKRLFALLALLLCLLCLCSLSACKKETDYFLYVSELRENVFVAKTETFSLRVHAVQKETPYETDGIARETSMRTEIYLTAPSGDKTCTISFAISEHEYGGEMSYDNVKAEYYYSCSLDVSSLKEISFDLEYGEEKIALCAKSVKTERTLTPRAVLQTLQTA